MGEDADLHREDLRVRLRSSFGQGRKVGFINFVIDVTPECYRPPPERRSRRPRCRDFGLGRPRGHRCSKPRTRQRPAGSRGIRVAVPLRKGRGQVQGPMVKGGREPTVKPRRGDGPRILSVPDDRYLNFRGEVMGVGRRGERKFNVTPVKRKLDPGQMLRNRVETTKFHMSKCARCRYKGDIF